MRRLRVSIPGAVLATVAERATQSTPLCLVALEMRTGRVVRQWQDELGPFPPYRLDSDALFIGYMLSAEFGCHIALGWGQPACALDPYIEFRHFMNDGTIKSGDREKGFLQPRRCAALFLRGRHRYRAQDGHARPDPTRAAVHRHRARSNPGILRRRHPRAGSPRPAHHPDHPIASARHVARQVHVAGRAA